MARQLWLLRHGDAEPHGARPDDERRLAPRGEGQATVAGAALAALGLEVALAFTSPKVRARDTARLACQALNVVPEEAEVLADGFSRDDALDLLLAHDDDDDARVLVVGHNPSFEQVVLDLSGARVDFKKGGVVALRIERRAGMLIVALRPRELESLAV
jgi:phosphohistidine phosphatase